MTRFTIALAAFLVSVVASGADSEAAAPISRPTSFEAQKALAESGDPVAQTLLGHMYASGQGVAQDDGQAAAWYRKAADQGYASAQLALGIAHVTGRGVTKDDAEAAAWYRKAADQGNAPAQFNLGIAYANGRGVAKDAAEAAAWLRKAADQGFAPAQSRLVGGQVVPDAALKPTYLPSPDDMYPSAAKQAGQEGRVKIKVCVDEAGKLGEVGVGESSGFPLLDDAGIRVAKGGRYQAANRGGKPMASCANLPMRFALTNNAGAHFRTGVRYYSGEGVPKDYAEAAHWLQLAADLGHAGAQFNLGVMHYNGEGVPKSLAETYKWFSLAAAKGDDEAKKSRAILENQMTPEQIAEAKRLAAEWKPHR